MKEILSTPMVIVYAILAVGLYTPLSVLADLWGVAYLMAKYGFARGDAAEVSMTMYIGLCIGSLLLPWLSEKYNVLNRSIRVCTYGIFFAFACILMAPQLPVMGITVLILLLGAFGGAEMLCFTGVILYAPKGRTGITLGITNTVNMIGGALAQQSVGLILDRFLWKGDLDVHEFIGTCLLVLMGCGCAVFAGADVGFVGVALAFGTALLFLAYCLGPISGCHLNPAVTLCLAFSYIVAQCFGAILGGFIIYMIASGKAGFDIHQGFALNGFAEHSPKGYNMISCLITEVVMTAVLLFVILSTTQKNFPAQFTGVTVEALALLFSMAAGLLNNYGFSRPSFKRISIPLSSSHKIRMLSNCVHKSAF
eukprot:gene15381-15522_t